MTIADGIDLLGGLDTYGFVRLFWYTVLLECPRYGLGAVVALIVSIANKDWLANRTGRDDGAGRVVSVLIPCHNEAGVLRRSVISARDQIGLGANTRIEIIVIDDGSTDRTRAVAQALSDEGLADRVLSVAIRGGKSAAINLAIEYAAGEFVIITDADTTFDRYAFKAVLAKFRDPDVGAVSGNLYARNADASVVSGYQAVEYLVSIALGRRITNMIDTLFIVSGAFGAFRRRALIAIGGYDAEVGEDADLTTRLRRAGWRIGFAPNAWSLTNVPETAPALVNQRLRWERAVVTIWLRKFRSVFDPRRRSFSLLDAVGVFDILFFQVLLCLSFPVYIAWLFATFGQAALVVLTAVAAVYVIAQLCLFLVALAISAPYGSVRLMAYVPLFAIANGYVMRFVRLYAYLDELIFRSSYRDPYVPKRVHRGMEQL